MDARSPDMPRRAFTAIIAGGLLARPLAVGAQPARNVPRVGLLLLFGMPGRRSVTAANTVSSRSGRSTPTRTYRRSIVPVITVPRTTGSPYTLASVSL